MIRNYLLITLRNLRKNRLTSTINILSLGISLAACAIIVLILRREMSYDTALADHDRTYRLTEFIDSGTNLERSSSCPFPALPTLHEENDDLIEASARVFDFQNPTTSMKLEDGQLFNESQFYFVDSTITEVFDIPIIHGDRETPLDRPFTMMIREDVAKKWFGDEDPIGRSVFLAGQDQFRTEITAVFAESSGPSHFTPRGLKSISTTRTFAPYLKNNWIWNPCWSYFKLKEGVQVASLEARFPDFVKKHYPGRAAEETSHGVQRIADIHLKSDLEFEMGKNSSMKFIYIFAFSAFFLLVVACVNFVNLTSISLSGRVKEIGVRKVSGATRRQLVAQFLFESLFTTLIAFAVGLLIMALVYSPVATLIDLPIHMADVFHPGTILLLALIVVATGLLAGLYPSFILSQVDPVLVFKGGRHQAKGKGIRKALVIFQFGIALVLLVFTIVSQKQVRYMLGKDHGYDMENVVLVEITTTGLNQQVPTVRQAMLKDPRVKSVTVMNNVIGIDNNNHDFWYEGVPQGEFRYFPALMVDEEFLKTLDIELVAGRDYDATRQREDSLSVIINESLAKYLGYASPEEALGREFHSNVGAEKIIGVAKDFNFKSLHHPVGPFVLEIPDRGQTGQFYFFMRTLAIKVDAVDAEVLAHLEHTWDQFVDNKPFDHRLLSDEIAALYKEESRMGTVLALFSGLSIMIACMGLFALTWFLAKLKVKEIALRKTLGAELPHLIMISTKEQMIMVGIAILFGVPAAYVLVTTWLNSFAFRVAPGSTPYVISAVAALAVAFLSMVFLAYRTSQRDPAPVLKYE